MTAVVYRIFDRSGRLIYVGATTNLEQRIEDHRTGSWWYGLMDRVDSEPHPTIKAAFAAEKLTIRAEQPAFNFRHTGRDYWNPPLTRDDRRACREWAAAKPGRVGYLQMPLRHIAYAAA